MKSRSISALCLTASMVFTAQSVSARDFAEIYTECGLGAMIAPSSDAVAAVTNVTWDLGTTAVSSNATSPETCQGGKVKTAAFIYQGYDKLEMDIAKGSGEYIDQLTTLMGTESASQEKTVKRIRSELKNVLESKEYSQMSHYEKSQSLYGIVLADIS